MKIAIIHSELHKMGGSQRQALELCIELNRLGHDAVMYAVHFDKENCFPELCEKIKVVSLYEKDSERKDSERNRIKDNNKSRIGLVNFIKVYRDHNKEAKRLSLLIDSKTDVLNSHNRIGFRTAYYFKNNIRNIPSVLMVNDIMTKGWSFWRKSNFDSTFKLSLKRKIFYWLVDFYETNKFMKTHEAMTVLDNRTKEWAKKYYEGVPTYVVRSGMDIDRFSFQARPSISKNKISLLAVGIFFMHRRYEDVIRSVKILAESGYNASLDIIGGYDSSFRPYYEKLVALVGELGLKERVKFVGRVSDEELRSAYRSHDIYISPNHLQSWGIAVFEAMASGMPTIVSRTAGASEVLTDGVNTLLVDPAKPEGIAEAIKRYADSSEFYQEIISNGRQFVEINISWTNYAKGMIKIFGDLMAKQ